MTESNARTAGVPEASYSADQPIRSKEQDRFNRWPFAKRIAETLSARRDPSSLVIGIYGAWGEGKTSVLAMMREALSADPRIITVPFNPWHFGSEEQVLRSFFKMLAGALGKALTTKLEDFGKLLDEYGGAILSAASLTVGHGMVRVDAGSAAKGVGKALSNVDLDTHRQRIEKILQGSGKRVLVLIDDIDRLDRHEIHTIFKLVKLSANFECISYVLAFDDEMVAEALGERYGGGGVKAGRAFLEKIVQVPLNLPPADSLSLLTLVLGGIQEALGESGIDLPEEQFESFVHHFVEGIAPRLTTPRQANLYVNALTFALPIMKGEVSPLDQMLIEGIRVFHPKLYAAIRDNGIEFLRMFQSGREAKGALESVKEIVESSLDGIDERLRKKVRELVEVLFPRVKGGFDSEWDGIWQQAKRICSAAYFERYFRYGVASDDVSDVAVAQFLASVENLSEAETVQRFKEMVTVHSSHRFIQKIRDREDEFSVEVATRLAMAVVSNGSLLAREKAMFLSDWTLTQGAILVSHLVARVQEDARAGLARRIFATAEPLRFALECIKWMRRAKGESRSDRYLPGELVAELSTMIARRIADAAAETPLYLTHERDAAVLYWFWNTYGSTSGEVADHLQKRFEADSAEVEQFLATFVGNSWDMQTGHPGRSEFEGDAYDAVAKLVDPEVVLAKLRERFGARLESPKKHHSVDTAPRERISEQFAFEHKAAIAQKQTPEDPPESPAEHPREAANAPPAETSTEDQETS